MIQELKSKEEMRAAFPIVKQLRTHLDEPAYLRLVEEARQKDNYRMFALIEDNKIVAVTGFKPMITLYYGRFIWVCDLVTEESARSKGYGEELLQYVEKFAEEHGFTSVALSSGLSRTDAHRFYEDKMDYDKVSYVFKKDLHED